MNSPSKEHALLDSLRPYLNFKQSHRYPFGIGDDAVVRNGAAGERLIFTADTSVENVHFSLKYMTLAEAGYKAMATNVSDCAAMGAQPDGALVQIIFPKNTTGTSRDIKALYRGFHKACKEWSFPIIGGDLSGGPCWGIAITLLGRMEKGTHPMMRSGARHGDGVWLTGFPGRSAAGLDALLQWGRKKVPPQFRSLVNSHVKPQPRISAGLAFARNKKVHAMMDLSDGLSKDAATMAWESKVGIILDLPALSIPADMAALGVRLKKDWREWALHGGEDYELLFTADSGFDPGSVTKPLGVSCVRIGQCDRRVTGIVDVHGKRIKTMAWDHCG